MQFSPKKNLIWGATLPQLGATMCNQPGKGGERLVVLGRRRAVPSASRLSAAYGASLSRGFAGAGYGAPMGAYGTGAASFVNAAYGGGAYGEVPRGAASLTNAPFPEGAPVGGARLTAGHEP